MVDLQFPALGALVGIDHRLDCQAREVESNECRKLAKHRDRLSEPLALQGLKVFFDGSWRVFQTRSLHFGGGADDVGREIKLIVQKGVGVLCLDSERLEGFVREMPEVECYDDIRPAVDRGGKHMAIIRVRQRESRHERLIAGDEAVPDLRVHQLAGPLQLPFGKVRAVSQKVSNPLIMNGV